MNFDHFVGQVQHRARLGSSGDAVCAIQAVFQTLSERLNAGETKDLISQLPREFGIYFQVAEHSQRFSLDDFFHRISQREQVDVPEAVFHARVVLEVMQEAVSQGEVDDVKAQLPEEWRDLFEAGSEGDLRLKHTHAVK
jgi:uncharacterized protein (DUF2267 family)